MVSELKEVSHKADMKVEKDTKNLNLVSYQNMTQAKT